MGDVAVGVVGEAQNNKGGDEHHEGMKMEGFVDMAMGEGQGGAGEAAAGAGLPGDDGKWAEGGSDDDEPEKEGADACHAQSAA